MALPLIGLVDCELTKQRDRDRIGLVALMRLGEKRALDLRGAQGHVADNRSRRGVADDAGARKAGGMIVPGVTEPSVQGIAPAVEPAAVVLLGQRSRRGYFRHVGGRLASSFRP